MVAGTDGRKRGGWLWWSTGDGTATASVTQTIIRERGSLSTLLISLSVVPGVALCGGQCRSSVKQGKSKRELLLTRGRLTHQSEPQPAPPQTHTPATPSTHSRALPGALSSTLILESASGVYPEGFCFGSNSALSLDIYLGPNVDRNLPSHPRPT